MRRYHKKIFPIGTRSTWVYVKYRSVQLAKDDRKNTAKEN